MDKSDLDPAFDTEGLFDDDYLYFFATRDPGGELSDAETDLIWRLLSLEADMTVLDLACGHGRIANRLAARGAVVTGLDVTPRFLEVAREDAAERGVEVEYVQGDMRSLPWTGRFDRVVNWFTAFGYFDDADNRQVLASVARALKPGGRAAIELNNYPAIMRSYPAVNRRRAGRQPDGRPPPVRSPARAQRGRADDHPGRFGAPDALRGTHVHVPGTARLAARGRLQVGGRSRRGRRAADRRPPSTDRRRGPRLGCPTKISGDHANQIVPR